MNLYVFIIFFFVFVAGILCNFLLFRQDKNALKNTRFITSERLIIFIVEIFIAVIGFGVTLGITNENERNIEKEQAIQMLEQAIDYSDMQASVHNTYIAMYNNQEISLEELIVSDVINFDYYDNILASETVLQNADMKTYGDIMLFLQWAKNNDEKIKTTSDNDKQIAYIQQRGRNLLKLNCLLKTCVKELNGQISTEDASKECRSIRNETNYNNLF